MEIARSKKYTGLQKEPGAKSQDKRLQYPEPFKPFSLTPTSDIESFTG
jgi:hypothetical protein